MRIKAAGCIALETPLMWGDEALMYPPFISCTLILLQVGASLSGAYGRRRFSEFPTKAAKEPTPPQPATEAEEIPLF